MKLSWFASLLLLLPVLAEVAEVSGAQPNVVIIFCDDLGYGDLGCYGHPTIATPQLDQMAREGMRFTQFYAAASVCTPSRSALMTGRLPIRTGMSSTRRRVLFPDSAGGLQDNELTLAEALKSAGYATACVGKWHLGHLPQYLPTRHGFDSYFGIPYSNDMDRVAGSPNYREANFFPKVEYFNVPLMRDLEVVERPAEQSTLTKRYTEAAVHYIRKQAQTDQPFLLYLAHTMPHIPLFRSDEFVDQSLRGLYGDVVEEIDNSVGTVLSVLRELQIDDQTLVFFTSDNGPWTVFDQIGGSAGLLRDGKGTTWEGGMREPCLVWWPGSIPAHSVNRQIASTMDIFATCLRLAGAEMPSDRVIDGVDLSATLRGEGPSGRTTMFYYWGRHLNAVRSGPYKAHYRIGNGKYLERPMLFHLEHDPGEQYDLAEQHPEILQQLAAVVVQHQRDLVVAPTQLESRISR